MLSVIQTVWFQTELFLAGGNYRILTTIPCGDAPLNRLMVTFTAGKRNQHHAYHLCKQVWTVRMLSVLQQRLADHGARSNAITSRDLHQVRGARRKGGVHSAIVALPELGLPVWLYS